jgi:hypothetical protein
MISFFLFFFCFLPYFSAPSGSKGKVFFVTSQSFPELTSHACLHGVVWLALFVTSEMVLFCFVFFLQLQKSEVVQEHRDPQTVFTAPMPHQSHQRTLS